MRTENRIAFSNLVKRSALKSKLTMPELKTVFGYRTFPNVIECIAMPRLRSAGLYSKILGVRQSNILRYILQDVVDQSDYPHYKVHVLTHSVSETSVEPTGAYLRRNRKSKAATGVWLADQLGISRNRITDIESRNKIGIDKLVEYLLFIGADVPDGIRCHFQYLMARDAKVFYKVSIKRNWLKLFDNENVVVGT